MGRALTLFALAAAAAAAIAAAQSSGCTISVAENFGSPRLQRIPVGPSSGTSLSYLVQHTPGATVTARLFDAWAQSECSKATGQCRRLFKFAGPQALPTVSQTYDAWRVDAQRDASLDKADKLYNSSRAYTRVVVSRVDRKAGWSYGGLRIEYKLCGGRGSWRLGNASIQAVEPVAPSCAFHQTAGCSPFGARQPTEDKPCSAIVKQGWSGYCKCADGRQTFPVGCGKHPPFTCADACRVPEEWTCDPNRFDDGFCDNDCGFPDRDCEDGVRVGWSRLEKPIESNAAGRYDDAGGAVGVAKRVRYQDLWRNSPSGSPRLHVADSLSNTDPAWNPQLRRPHPALNDTCTAMYLVPSVISRDSAVRSFVVTHPAGWTVFAYFACSDKLCGLNNRTEAEAALGAAAAKEWGVVSQARHTHTNDSFYLNVTRSNSTRSRLTVTRYDASTGWEYMGLQIEWYACAPTYTHTQICNRTSASSNCSSAGPCSNCVVPGHNCSDYERLGNATHGTSVLKAQRDASIFNASVVVFDYSLRAGDTRKLCEDACTNYQPCKAWDFVQFKTDVARSGAGPAKDKIVGRAGGDFGTGRKYCRLYTGALPNATFASKYLDEQVCFRKTFTQLPISTFLSAFVNTTNDTR